MQTRLTWKRRGAFFLFTLLAFAVAAYAFGYLFLPFRAGDPFAASFAISGKDVPVHFFLAALALLLAPVQLSARLRRAAPALHRLLGWLYALSVLSGGIAGFTLAQDAQGGLPSRLGFSVLAIGWIGTTVVVADETSHSFSVVYPGPQVPVDPYTGLEPDRVDFLSLTQVGNAP